MSRVERSDLRGLSCGKEKAELLHVLCVLKRAAGSDAIYAQRPTRSWQRARARTAAELSPLWDGVLFFEARFQFLQINGNTRVRVSGRGAEILHRP